MSGNPRPPNKIPTLSIQPPDEIWAETNLQMVNISFVWAIEHFFIVSTLSQLVRSPSFSADGFESIKWRLKLFPKATSEYMSLYLELLSSDREKILTNFSFCILNNEGLPKFQKSNLLYEFTPESCRGVTEFVKLSELKKLEMKLLTGKKLKIQCELEMAFTLYSSIGKCARFKCDSSKVSLSKDMGKILESQKFCDVVLVGSDGSELPAHKALLAGRSAVFASMFDHQMKENVQNRVEISDISSGVLQEVLRYIYTGKSPNLTRMANDLLIAADKYGLDGLKGLCMEFLSRNLTVDSAAEVCILADVHNAKQLKACVIDFICAHPVSFTERSDWENLLIRHPALAKEISKAIASRSSDPPLKKLKPSSSV